MPEAGHEDATFGLVTLAGVEAALPLSALREVVPCPAELAELPLRAEGMLGAMTLREIVVPVLDLRAQLGSPAERGEDQVVVIIADEDRVLGLLADGTRHVHRVPAEDLRAVQTRSGELLFSHTFRHPETGSVVSVLDVAALLALPGVPTVHDPAVAGDGGPAHGDSERRGDRSRLTLLQCGAHLLALDVAHVHTTRADAWPRPSVFDGPLCQGVTEYRGMRVPVVDPLALLGLGRLPEESTGHGLVLDLGEGYVVLALTALVDIRDVAAGDVHRVPAFAVRRPDLLAGMGEVEGVGQCLVLDGDALHAEEDLCALAALNTAVEGEAEAGDVAEAGQAGGDTAAVRGPVYLSYSVGVDIATPLEQVAEIVTFPSERIPTDVGDIVLGVVVHRDAAVPVLCLPTLLGLSRPEIAPSACLLIVEVDGDRVGFAVQALRAIDPLAWKAKRDVDAGERDDARPLDPGSALRDAALISVGEDPRLLPELDLRAIARAVRAELAAGADALSFA
jgi:purine-binding chemotaxis protein CheW